MCSAMSGGMKFEEALASRLTLMQVTSEKMEEFIQQHPPRLSPGELGTATCCLHVSLNWAKTLGSLACLGLSSAIACSAM